ncbi:hypothetical protein ABN147_11975, partial [Klebsiella oxytoca]|uniref:hypothetical protein n=1 Tax=Klebsiella oxytoca TaxID=571 RepID=UPI0032DA9DA7
VPGAALDAPCPGYRYSAVCGPVVPTVHRRLRLGSPDRCAASPPGSWTLRSLMLSCQPQLLQVAIQL